MLLATKLTLYLLFPVLGLTLDYNGTVYNFEPFFEENGSGVIPKFPDLTDFDREILKICGAWGVQPKEKDFRALLNNPQYQSTINVIYDTLNHQVITVDANLELFKDELIRIWFKNSGVEKETMGFAHIFCGQPDKLGLGGMHFAGRYVEAQENKWAGAIWNNSSLCDKLDIHPPVYTLGIQYMDRDNTVKIKCPGGYAYNLHADDIIIFATQAFKELGRDGTYIYKIKGTHYESVFVRHNDAILTFYPTTQSH